MLKSAFWFVCCVVVCMPMSTCFADVTCENDSGSLQIDETAIPLQVITTDISKVSDIEFTIPDNLKNDLISIHTPCLSYENSLKMLLRSYNKVFFYGKNGSILRVKILQRSIAEGISAKTKTNETTNVSAQVKEKLNTSVNDTSSQGMEINSGSGEDQKLFSASEINEEGMEITLGEDGKTVVYSASEIHEKGMEIIHKERGDTAPVAGDEIEEDGMLLETNPERVEGELRE